MLRVIKIHRILLASFAALLMAAAPAVADDASLDAAWDSKDAQFKELGRSVEREFTRWGKRNNKGDAKLLRLMKRGETLTVQVEQAVNAEQPSTPQGSEAKTLILKSLASFKQHFVEHRKAIRAAPSRRAVNFGQKADRALEASEADAKKAEDLLAQVGVQQP